MSEKEHIFQLLKQLADSIVNTFQRNCEVVIHDLTDFHKSIFYIAGNVTGRKIGAPITDLVVRALQIEGHNIKDRYNYKTTTSDGRALKSTTSFIRDSKGEVICAFCINFDMTDYVTATLALETFIDTTDFNGNDKKETFATSISETIDALFEQAVTESGKQPVTMSTKEKITLVEVLQREGTFQIKGAVDRVAMLLGVSKYTVYNYLQKIRAAHSANRI
jgi:predicted transcriptional regulator YheO